jgi:hypothetical protein
MSTHSFPTEKSALHAHDVVYSHPQICHFDILTIIFLLGCVFMMTWALKMMTWSNGGVMELQIFYLRT